MAWSTQEFMRQLDTCGNRYEAENAWFKNWGERKFYAVNAWRLYRYAARNSLGMLLLGSAKIRTDPGLVANFGVTSGGGVSDPEEMKLIAALEAERGANRTAPGLKDAPMLLGTGSILNDQNWTPLLNDCYILGGVHGGHEFHYAEDNAHKHFVSLDIRAGSERRPPPDVTDKWMSYLRANPETFWDSKLGNPRVLARELIGLKAFGFRPSFFREQLSFSGAAGNSQTFTTYLDAISGAGLLTRNRTLVLSTLSQFLFGKTDALGN